MCRLFLSFVYFCIVLEIQLQCIKRKRTPFTGLTLPHFSACLKQGIGFPTPYVIVFFMFNGDCSFCRSGHCYNNCTNLF